MTHNQEISDAITRLPDQSAYWRRVRNRLRKLSKRNPQEFWDAYLSVVFQPDPDRVADLHELLAANPSPSFGDGISYLAERNRVSE
jgi:hypothetical protein